MSLLSMQTMLIEFTRLMLGLSIALFHRPIADFILERERSLVVLLRQRGLPVPAAPTRETAHTLYFCIGIFVAGWELARIYMLHRGLL